MTRKLRSRRKKPRSKRKTTRTGTNTNAHLHPNEHDSVGERIVTTPRTRSMKRRYSTFCLLRRRVTRMTMR
jgi:hypothetical protein